jgi:type VI secretion system protein ImpF
MPTFDSGIRITPSVLDRLIDHEPAVSSEPPPSRSRSLRQLKEAVRRDLEWLLNTRRLVDEIPPGLKETGRSLAAYGLPDLSSTSVKNPGEQGRLRRLIQTTIDIFEPRLRDVEVVLETGRGMESALHFRIEANLQVEPAPEPITFDTTLQIASAQFEVQGE